MERLHSAAIGLGLGATLLLNGHGQILQTREAGTTAKPIASAQSIPAPAADTIRFSGKVVDADGQLVAGAELKAYVSPNAPVLGAELELSRQLTTGPDGHFEVVLPRGGVELTVQKVGLAPAAFTQWNQGWSPAQDATDETLVLNVPTIFAGTVVDEADKPVADAEVFVTVAYLENTLSEGGSAYAYLHRKAARQLFSTRTGPDGKFRFTNFPPGGSADLGVSKPGKVQRAIEREQISPETLFHPREEALKLVMEPAGCIAGKVVVQDTGQPVAGVRFSLSYNRPGYQPLQNLEAAPSGADGRFVLADLAPGNYMLRAAFGTNAVPEWVAEPVPVSVEPEKTVSDVQIQAVAGGFLKVVVLGKEDLGFVANASIQANKGAYRVSGITDTNGAVLFRVPPGTYQVFANRGDSRGEGITLAVESGETNRHEFLLTPPPRLLGTVRDPAGQPARGLPVILVGGFYGTGGSVQTDAEGHFEMPFNPAGFSSLNNATPCLCVRDVAHNLVAAQDIESIGRPMELRLQPGLVVVGQVEDPNGKALTNATLQLSMELGNLGLGFGPGKIAADTRGRFELTALPPQHSYLVWASAKGYGSAYAKAAPEESSTNRLQLPPLVLKPANQKLAGQVVDADDKPVVGARVYIYGKDQPNASARSDTRGHFQFDAVCEGTVQVSASARGGNGLTSAQAGNTNVVVQLGLQQVRTIRASAPQRTTLKGQLLPDLTAVHLATDACPAGQPVVLCLFDREQRPSRRTLHDLAQQYDALKVKRVAVLGLQATVTSHEAFKEWAEASPTPFPVGYVSEKSDQTRWAAGVETLPWLILVDKNHRVVAEGFSLEELDTQLKALK